MMEEDSQVKIKKESSSSMGMTYCSDDSYYPYGTSISVEDDMIDELGASGMSVGDVVEIRGYAFVDNKSESSSKNDSNKSIRFQLTSLKIEREDDDRIKQMYGEES